MNLLKSPSPSLSEIDRQNAFDYNMAAAQANAARIKAYELQGVPLGSPSFFTGTAPRGNPDAQVNDFLTTGRPTTRQQLTNVPGGMEVMKSLLQREGPQMSQKMFEDKAYEQFNRTGTLPKPQSYVSNVSRDLTSPYYGVDDAIFNDPKFTALRQQYPAQAKATYKALTGIDYDEAVKSVAANYKNREEYSDALMKGLQGKLIRDDNDRLAKRISRMDSYGNVIEGTSALTPEEQAFIDRGEFQRRSGASVPAGITPEGMAPDARSTYVSAYQSAMAKSGGDKRYAEEAARRSLVPKQSSLVNRTLERRGVFGTIEENASNFGAEVLATLQNMNRGANRFLGLPVAPKRTGADYLDDYQWVKDTFRR